MVASWLSRWAGSEELALLHTMLSLFLTLGEKLFDASRHTTPVAIQAYNNHAKSIAVGPRFGLTARCGPDSGRIIIHKQKSINFIVELL